MIIVWLHIYALHANIHLKLTFLLQEKIDQLLEHRDEHV